ncbi:hypothetical protein PRIPAC_88141 [Pristionchus pacificus]|uniref:Uncharacterized protein n=1 Tax=Pristionchus pacificus TaxID=54126 RepID=A0A2A6CVM4_PRIPA|nr:hypothetical protein PRIPAC_88141 [Pristionchus pacificus]|eukprot:PDM82097.1 hypothetical protein PRIPAC_36490 [Pristionchus pacificus]
MPIGNIGSILEVSSTERCAPPLSWRSSLNHRIHPRLYSNLQLQHSATIDPAKRSDARMNMHSAIADKRIGDYSKNKAPRCHLQCQERATVSSSSVASYRTPTVLSVLHSRGDNLGSWDTGAWSIHSGRGGRISITCEYEKQEEYGEYRTTGESTHSESEPIGSDTETQASEQCNGQGSLSMKSEEGPQYAAAPSTTSRNKEQEETNATIKWYRTRSIVPYHNRVDPSSLKAIADKRIGDYSKNKAPRCHLQCQERATVSSSSVASYRTPTVLSVLHSREYQSRASTRNKRNKENTGRQANRLIPNQSPSEAIQRLKHQSSAMDKAV